MKRIFMTMLSMASLVVIVGVVGCTKSDLLSAPGNDNQLGFTTYMATKGVTKDAFAIGDKFAVMATQSKNPWTNTDADWFMGSPTVPTETYVTVTNTAEDTWRYSPVKTWPKEEKLSFFAFSPVPVEGGNDFGISGVTVDKGSPTIKFTVATDIKTQVDLLRAENLDQFQTNVQLTFNHALTRVSFAAKANVTGKQMVRLDKIELVGIKNTGTLKLYDDARTVGANNDLGGWATDPATTSYAPALSHEVVTVVPKELTPMTQDDQALFMIPQAFTVGGDAKLKVTYSYSNNSGKNWVNKSKFEIDLGSHSEYWNPGKNYRYVLTLSPDNVYTFNPDIVDWDATIEVAVKNAVSATKLDIGRDAASKNEFTVTTTSTQWKGYTLTSDATWLKITDKSDGTGAALTKEYTDQGVTKADYEMDKKWYLVAEENLTPFVRKAKVTLACTAAGLEPVEIEISQKTFDIDYSMTPANTYVLQTTDKGFIYMPGKRPITKAGSIGANVLTTNTTDFTATSARLQWQTGKDFGTATGIPNMTIRSIMLDPETGKCAIAITGHAGNAYIQVSNNPYWGCTVWVTKGEIKNTPPANGIQFMDRNLGAHAAIAVQPTEAEAYKYFGNLYQWGRFQPFTGQGNVESTSTTYPQTFNTNGDIRTPGALGGFTWQQTTDNALHTMPYMQQNPLYIFKLGGDTGLITGNPLTWSDTGDKSIYDPCPYGYRVPTDGAWAGITPNPSPGGKVNAGQVWNEAWWPLCGERGGGNGVLGGMGANGHYWSATASTGSGRASTTRFLVSTIELSYVRDRSNSFPVRCVAE